MSALELFWCNKKIGRHDSGFGRLDRLALIQTVMALKKYSNCLFPVIFGPNRLVLSSVREGRHKQPEITLPSLFTNSLKFLLIELQ